MGLYKQLPDDLNEVDIIIAGGGAAGCIVAGRLAATDPNLSILLIEWGRDNYNDVLVVNPGFWKFAMAPAAKSTISYVGNKAPQLADRNPLVPNGGILGGGSSINAQMYTRAQRQDFDSWNTPGWSTEDIIPFMKRLETYHGPGDASVHGYHGPVHISDSGYRFKNLTEDVLQAASAIGYPEITDLQDLDSNNGYSRWLRNNSLEGKRQDSAHTYLHPLLQDGKHPNLHVLVEHKVLRVLFEDDKRATGVELIQNPEFAAQAPIPLSTPLNPQKVTARKQVVLSSGACGTPLILERSGVGSPEILNRAEVPLLVDLPGVGHDYQDHHLTVMTYKTALDPDETPDRLYAGLISPQEALDNKVPMIRSNTVDIAAKIRPTDEEVAALGPEFQAAWDRDFRDNLNKPLMLSACFSGLFLDPSVISPGQYLSIGNYTAYPYSRGHIHIIAPPSTSNPTQDITSSSPIDFNLGFFTDPHDIDLKKLIWAYKKTREIIRRTALYRGELPEGHPIFPPGSKAGCITLDPDTTLLQHIRSVEQNPNAEITNLVYTPEDDAAIADFLRKTVNTTWHSLGTAKMAPREEKGVVDKELNVYGTSGLKVIDLSIVPENVGANTCNTAMIVGEKGADIIARELGLEIKGKGELIPEE